MAINVLWNKQSGPGAVPGASTILAQIYGQQGQLREFGLKDWGRNRIDACGKGSIFARYGTRRYRAM